jgi:hypothetical protein
MDGIMNGADDCPLGSVAAHSRVRQEHLKHEKGQVMITPEVSNLQKANGFLQVWTRQHNRAAILMAIPLLASFVVARFTPPVLGNIGMAVGPAIALTIGLAMIPRDFRSRSGSLTPAIWLVAAMWIAALGTVVFSLTGRH